MSDSTENSTAIKARLRVLILPLIDVQYHKDANQYLHYIKGLGKYGTLVATSHFNNVAGKALDASIDASIDAYLTQASVKKLLLLEKHFMEAASIATSSRHPEYTWTVIGEDIVVCHHQNEITRFWAGTALEMLGRDFVMKRVEECDNTAWITETWDPSKRQNNTVAEPLMSNEE
jgi:hypothetical protein